MSDLRYTKSHEWVNIDAETPIIGITQHAQDLLGDMVFVDLPEIGREVTVGEEIAVLESVKAASDLYAPISGIISAVNTDVADNPALLNSDPYDSGWLVQITPHSTEAMLAEVESLLLEDEYNSEIREEA